MKKAVCWGVGSVGRHVYEMCRESYDVLCFVDNDTSKYGHWGGLRCKSPEVLKSLDFDVLVLGTSMGFDEVSAQLKVLGIPEHKVNTTYVQIIMQSRILFRKRFAERACKESTDYDISREQKDSLTSADYFKNVTIDEVLAKMPHRENIILKSGRFPETASGIHDNFAFVNLDMDFYEPTIESLRFFYPLMSEGGVILIHDYFSEAYPNVELAVADFERELGHRLRKIPIGDDISMAILH